MNFITLTLLSVVVLHLTLKQYAQSSDSFSKPNKCKHLAKFSINDLI